MKYRILVWLLAASYFVANIVVGLSITDWSFIDENTYAIAAAKILLGEKCTIYQLNVATTCNYEHPPLAKALEAVSLLLFGWFEPRGSIFNAEYIGSMVQLSTSPLWFLSFRCFQISMGALSIVLIYVISVRISGNERLGLAAACLLVLEPLYFFFSRTDYLDIPMIFFALCAYAAYFSSVRFGPVSQFWLSGILMGLSVLCKESGLVFVVPLVAYHLMFGPPGRYVRLRGSLVIVIGMITTGSIGLQLYDSLGNTPFPTLFNQITYAFEYSRSIACHGGCLFGPGPTSWFEFFVPTRWSDGFSGNQILLWLVFAWVPLGAYLVWKARGAALGPELRLFVFACLLFASTFLENELIYLSNRKTWIYYYLIIVPSVSLGGAYLLTRPQLHRWIKVGVVAFILLGYGWAYAAGPSFFLYD